MSQRRAPSPASSDGGQFHDSDETDSEEDDVDADPANEAHGLPPGLRQKLLKASGTAQLQSHALLAPLHF